jgi:putative intracellular protease/amidase
MRQRAKGSYRSAYNTAREYPGTIAALIVGIGITAALLWAARRAGGWSSLQEDAKELARQGADYAREGYGKAREVIADRAAHFKGQPETLSE